MFYPKHGPKPSDICNSFNRMSRDELSWCCSNGSAKSSRTQVFHPASLPSLHLLLMITRDRPAIPSFGSTLNSSQTGKKAQGLKWTYSPFKLLLSWENIVSHSLGGNSSHCPFSYNPLLVLDHISTFKLIKENQFIIRSLNQS